MLEENETQETSLQDLIDLVERDDLPTNEFTIEDKDPMVILGKLNEVIAYLQTLQDTINSSDTKANEALQKAIQAVANAIEAISTANTAITASNTALSTANTAISTANTALSSANSAVETASNAVSTANSANTTANEAKSTAQEALDQVVAGLGTKVYRDTQLLTTLDIKPIEDDIAGNTTAINNEATTRANAVTALDNAKVDKVTGKQLSTEDFTTAEKTKLAGLNNYDDTQVQADLSSLSSNITNLSNQVQNDFVKQGLADINNCSTYDQIYTVLANSQNGTGVGDIGYASQSPIRTLLPTIPFVDNFVKVYAKIIAGTDANFWAIELYTIANVYNHRQAIPVYKMQIGRNIVGGIAQYRVSPWYNPATTILSANLGQNGYIIYTNGLIIQWGRFTSRGSGIQVTFPIAFTSSVFAIAGSNIAATNTNTTSTIKASNVTTASATFYAPYRGSGSSAGFTDSTSETFTWIAIGE